MGIKQPGSAGKAGEDVKQSVGAYPAKEAEAPVRAEGNKSTDPKTRQDYIKVLQGRGFEYKDLKKKKLGELKEMY